MTLTTPPVRDDPDRFGTPAFYASLGRAFVVMCTVVAALFGIELIDYLTSHRMDQHGGIITRQLTGLDGIVFAPFLHANWAHIYSNSVPLLVTGTFVLASGARRFFQVTAVVALVSGLAVWTFGPAHTVTIGASGVIFGYLGFLVMRGLVERTWWTVAVAVLVGLLFGIALSGVVPGDPHISWQDHLGGLVGGLVAAIVFRRRRTRVPDPAVSLPSTISIPSLD
jgi:membrane associated rhomboid family serine protease